MRIWNIQKLDCHILPTDSGFSDCKIYYLLTYSLTYLLTYSMEQSPSWKANRFSASQEIPRILWKVEVHFRIFVNGT